MTPLAKRIAAHLERMYLAHGWTLAGHGAFECQGLPDADETEGLAALRELEAAGMVRAEVEVCCPNNHTLWGGPEAAKPTGAQDCYDCHSNGCAYEHDDLWEEVRFFLTPAVVERLTAEAPFAPAVYARGLQAAEGCREIERLIGGLVRALDLVNRSRAAWGGCARPDCGGSTGIHGGLTFGWGELDDHGYWEHPCAPCARAYEARVPEYGPCWPYAEGEKL
jgi:hypothetical protein